MKLITIVSLLALASCATTQKKQEEEDKKHRYDMILEEIEGIDDEDLDELPEAEPEEDGG
jgi:hypothetical protein